MTRPIAIATACAILGTAAMAQRRPERCQLKFTGADPSEKVSVESVEFRGDSQLSVASQEEIERHVKSLKYDDTRELEDQVDVEIRSELERRGYFEMQNKITLNPARSDSQDKYDVMAKITAGDQFRTGDIQITGLHGRDDPLAIAPERLRELVSLQKGDLFDASAIRDAIQKINWAYGERGYIDATIDPEFAVDQTKHTIDLKLVVDHGEQYRISDVSVLGADPAMGSEFRSRIRGGEVYNARGFNDFVEAFVREHRDALAPEVSAKDIRVNQDGKTKTVSIQIDFRSCEQIPK